ncbi:MAG: helix-turn-helix domain-containing protein [Clostridia bacterium]|jgi:DNA-directed RNA polymerase specialized sigma subunit|nr:helix-turn-helix domain-containing protein [Clostridia bacterium]
MWDKYGSRVPWSLDLSLKDKADEVGVDFDVFIEQLSLNRSDTEIADELAVPEKVVQHLRQHFNRFGIHSIVGQD